MDLLLWLRSEGPGGAGGHAPHVPAGPLPTGDAGVRDPDRPRAVLLRVAEGTRFAAARRVLARASGAAPTSLWRVRSRPIADEDAWGLPPLLDGAVLTWGPRSRADAGATTGHFLVRPPADRTVVARAVPASVEARVVAGPDAGRRITLGPGRYVVGRAPSADIVVRDPVLSRRHAVLDVATDGVTLTDLGSTNGTAVDGAPASRGGFPAALGASLAMGSSVLVLTRPPERCAGGDRRAPSGTVDPHARGDGTLGINRSPRIPPERSSTLLQAPTEPPAADRPRLSLLTLLLPLAVSAVAAAVLKSAVFLAFGLLGPAMSGSQYLSDRRRHDERRRRDAERHRVALAQLRRRLGWLVEAELQARCRDHPDVAALASACASRTSLLWLRRPADEDWLELVIGRGRLTATAGVRGPDGETWHPTLEDVPVTVSLRRYGVLGVARGEGTDHVDPFDRPAARTSVPALVRSLLVQAIAWHGPRDLQVWLFAESEAEAAEWEWLFAAPHARDPDSACVARCGIPGASLAGAVADLTARLDESAGPGPDRGRPAILLVWLGAARLREHPGVDRLLGEGPAHGIHSVCVANSRAELPVECRAVVTTGPAGGTARLSTPDGSQRLVADGVAADVARDIVTDLAPLRDVTPGAGSAVPDVVRLGEVVHGDPFDPRAIAAGWGAVPATTRFVLGKDAAGPAELDLRRDGPHALVGGTTGAGKSELLRSLVVSLALRNRPDRLAFVLVDYKGGSAFDACGRLPHTVGIVTDLDADATRRALTGLEAELRSREARLRAAHVEDFEHYTAKVDAGALGPDGKRLPHLARLVIVVDEFRALVEDLPDFVAGLVRLAALGRSLGLHLVLATQRPAGIVSADMRANLALRISLRVRDAADSADIVETAAAAAISPRRPGRAFVRTGEEEPHLIQTTYLGRASEDGVSPRGPQLRLLGDGGFSTPIADLPLVAPPPPGPGDDRDDRVGRVARVDRASGEAARGPARDPVRAAAGDPARDPAARAPGEGGALPPSDIDRVADALRRAAGLVGALPPPPPWLGPLPTDLSIDRLRDDRSRPNSGPAVEPDAADARRRAAPSRGGARACERELDPVLLVDDEAHQRRWPQAWHPGTGSLLVVGGPRSGRTTTLRAMLAALLEATCPSRLTAYVVDPAGALGDVADHPHVGAYLRLTDEGALRRLAAALRDSTQAGRAPDDPVSLLVVDGWEQTRAALDRIDHGSATDDLVQAVRGGCSLLAAGGRDLLTGPLASLATERLILDLPDPTDAYLAGLDAGVGRLPPGRGRLAPSGLTAQVARLPDTVDLAARASASRHRHRRCAGPRFRVHSLPARITPAELPAPQDPGLLALGLAGDGTAATVLLDGRAFLVAGPRGSGRTTALRRLAECLTEAGRAWLGVNGRDPHQSSAALAARLRAAPGTIVLLDDVDALLGSDYEDVLVAHVESRYAGSVVAAGTLGTLATTYRGLIGVLRRSTYGLLLRPGLRAAELFGDPLPGGEPALPGRGFLVDEQRVTAIQVAAPSPDPGPAGAQEPWVSADG